MQGHLTIGVGDAVARKALGSRAAPPKGRRAGRQRGQPGPSGDGASLARTPLVKRGGMSLVGRWNSVRRCSYRAGLTCVGHGDICAKSDSDGEAMHEESTRVRSTQRAAVIAVQLRPSLRSRIGLLRASLSNPPARRSLYGRTCIGHGDVSRPCARIYAAASSAIDGSGNLWFSTRLGGAVADRDDGRQPWIAVVLVDVRNGHDGPILRPGRVAGR
jgi:hypothetical protein